MLFRPLAVLVLLSGTIAACAEPPVTGTLTVRVLETSSEALNRTVEILSRRFSEVLPSRGSTVAATVTDRTITFTFRGAVPAEDELHYLTFTRGELSVGPADDTASTWVSDRDVQKASFDQMGEVPYVQVWLNPDTGRRLTEITSTNVGRMLLVRWDGKEVVTAPILGAIGNEMVFNTPSLSEARLMKIVLQVGRLPTTIEDAEFRHGV